MNNIRIEESYSAHTKSLDKNGNPSSAEVHYIVFDVADEDAALKAVYDYVPKSMNAMTLQAVPTFTIHHKLSTGPKAARSGSTITT